MGTQARACGRPVHSSKSFSTYKAQPNGLKITVHGTNTEGQTVHFEMSPKYDFKDYPMTRSPDADPISMKKIDEYTIESGGKKAGTPMITTRSVVCRDGRTRTTTQKGKNDKGQMNNTIVFGRNEVPAALAAWPPFQLYPEHQPFKALERQPLNCRNLANTLEGISMEGHRNVLATKTGTYHHCPQRRR